MSERNSIDLARDPRSIFGTRLFDAPRDLVFSAWTDPSHLAQWWGLNSFTTTTSAFKFRPGGEWRFVMHGPDGRDYQNCIILDEIVRPTCIAYHHAGGSDVEPVSFTQIMTFEDLGSRQTRVDWHSKFPSAAERARVINEYGAEKGQAQTMARLADFVAAKTGSA